MADKLPYPQAMYQVCALMGWTEAGQPVINQDRGMTVVKAGRGNAIVLMTNDSDIRSAWDPLDGDRQVRARDQLISVLKRMGIRPETSYMIDPSMWGVS
ncbi:hypothetical protein ABZR86_17845 [Dyella marensis]|uniref:Uncharacterized protein n=1 Tax=Dyella marensis TaxID=500610 RepID=A0A1I2J617_9GAMM|nr:MULTISPECIES: hypothetical protein [Dyella]SFF48141.1 hypothetical protein SAMN02799615_03777 [Dyella marensis]